MKVNLNEKLDRNEKNVQRIETNLKAVEQNLVAKVELGSRPT